MRDGFWLFIGDPTRLAAQAFLDRMTAEVPLPDSQDSLEAEKAAGRGGSSAHLAPRVGSSAGLATSCRAARRRETRSQRDSGRVRPWCPKGGRGRARQRWDFSWGPYVASQSLGVPPTGKPPSSPQDVRARGAVGIDAPGK